MREEKSETVARRGPWTCVEKVRAGNDIFYINVICPVKPSRNAVPLAGGMCARARCSEQSFCFRQIKFNDGQRAYEFSCVKHMSSEKKGGKEKAAKKKTTKAGKK